MFSRGPESLQRISSPEGRYGQFAELVKQTQNVIYAESKRILAGRQLRKPPAYIVCPTEAFVSFIKQEAEIGAVDTGHRGEKLVPDQAELVWIPSWNAIVIPERLVDMSQSQDVLEQMDAKMKLGEDIIHAVTTVEDRQTHLLRTGFNNAVGYAQETGLESGAVYVASDFPNVEKNGEEGQDNPSQDERLHAEQREFTEAATAIVMNSLLAKICNIPTYTKMQLVLGGFLGEFEFDVPLKSNKAQFERIFQALYDGKFDGLDRLSMIGTAMSPVIRNGRVIEVAPTSTTHTLDSILRTYRRTRMLSVAETGRKELDVYNYQALRS